MPISKEFLEHDITDVVEKAPLMKFALISNVWMKLMSFRKAGDFNPGHSHTFDHGTLLSQGSLEVDIDGQKTVFKAPTIIYIEKGKDHILTALEDNTVACCIHAIRDGEAIEDIVDAGMIPKGANPRTIIPDFNFTPLTDIG
jgi:hypothetical protein